MSNEQIKKLVKKELVKNIDQRHKKGFDRYSKGKTKKYGVKTPIVRQIARNVFHFVKEKDKEEIFSLCQDLLQSGFMEDAIIAFQWALQFKKQYQKSDFYLFEKWLLQYIDNWAKCDDFACHILAEFLKIYPFAIELTSQRWISSDNIWARRASAVCLIPLIRKDKNLLPHIFFVAKKLLNDQDDMVRKGYGWLLKESSQTGEKEVFDFVMENKKTMPRVALRYAIEKMPRKLKEKAMQKK